ncbi:hypothetical protein BC567DRAFT_268243 [Phyllosticta citribraziliensis]
MDSQQPENGQNNVPLKIETLRRPHPPSNPCSSSTFIAPKVSTNPTRLSRGKELALTSIKQRPANKMPTFQGNSDTVLIISIIVLILFGGAFFMASGYRLFRNFALANMVPADEEEWVELQDEVPPLPALLDRLLPA